MSGPRRYRDPVGLLLTLATTAATCVLVIGGMRACMDVKVRPYETSAGWPTRLDGEQTTVDALDIGDARRLHPEEPIFVVGYLLAPYDVAPPRLCTRLEESGLCREPSLPLLADVDLLTEAPALEHGCCATGLWSPKPVVLRVRFRGRLAHVLG
jgi:hypothetical protein